MPILSLLGVEGVVSTEKNNEMQKHEQFIGNRARKLSAYTLGKPFNQSGKGIVDTQFWG